MKKTPIIIVAVVAALVVLVAVISIAGNKDTTPSMNNAPDGSSSSSTTSTESMVAPADAVAATTVGITEFKYMAPNIKVKVGDTVTWTNNDTVRHNVAGVNNEMPEGKLLSKGETYSYTFTKAGVFNYACTPHPYMKGSVTVE